MVSVCVNIILIYYSIVLHLSISAPESTHLVSYQMTPFDTSLMPPYQSCRNSSTYHVPTLVGSYLVNL